MKRSLSSEPGYDDFLIRRSTLSRRADYEAKRVEYKGVGQIFVSVVTGAIISVKIGGGGGGHVKFIDFQGGLLPGTVLITRVMSRTT